ncbi:Non-specific lipid-transfer protein [Homalodisca vitripennis]|nr:Non-specific lipid-transfer protein [Homalodisca vitripennis]
MWEEYSRNPNSVLDWQLQFRDFMFDLEDTSGDGAIDEEEFAMICSSYNVPEQNARDAFRKFSRNGTLETTREVWGAVGRILRLGGSIRPRELHLRSYQVRIGSYLVREPISYNRR